MKAYHGFFKKKNGTMREMLFTELDNLPEEYLNTKISGTGSTKSYAPGMQLVWDLEENDFRVFNFNTAVGVIQEIVVDKENYLKS